MITEFERAKDIEEVLGIFKAWNPDWDPAYAMTDLDASEISALKSVFPGITNIVCLFHLFQAWKRNLSNYFTVRKFPYYM